jgi:hypothetical protein
LGGKAELPFYIYDNILEDFDGNGTSQNWYWGTDVRGAWWDAASFTVEPASGGWIGFEAYAGYWDHNMQFNGKAAPSSDSWQNLTAKCQESLDGVQTLYIILKGSVEVDTWSFGN